MRSPLAGAVTVLLIASVAAGCGTDDVSPSDSAAADDQSQSQPHVVTIDAEWVPDNAVAQPPDELEGDIDADGYLCLSGSSEMCDHLTGSTTREWLLGSEGVLQVVVDQLPASVTEAMLEELVTADPLEGLGPDAIVPGDVYELGEREIAELTVRERSAWYVAIEAGTRTSSLRSIAWLEHSRVLVGVSAACLRESAMCVAALPSRNDMERIAASLVLREGPPPSDLPAVVHRAEAAEHGIEQWWLYSWPDHGEGTCVGAASYYGDPLIGVEIEASREDDSCWPLEGETLRMCVCSGEGLAFATVDDSVERVEALFYEDDPVTLEEVDATIGGQAVVVLTWDPELLSIEAVVAYDAQGEEMERYEDLY